MISECVDVQAGLQNLHLCCSQATMSDFSSQGPYVNSGGSDEAADLYRSVQSQ